MPHCLAASWLRRQPGQGSSGQNLSAGPPGGLQHRQEFREWLAGRSTSCPFFSTIGPGEFGTWQARIPEATGEPSRPGTPLRELLDRFDQLTGEHPDRRGGKLS